jgi:hypothetical protein
MKPNQMAPAVPAPSETVCHSMVLRKPSSRGILALRPNSCSARVVSNRRRGWPSDRDLFQTNFGPHNRVVIEKRARTGLVCAYSPHGRRQVDHDLGRKTPEEPLDFGPIAQIAVCYVRKKHTRAGAVTEHLHKVGAETPPPPPVTMILFLCRRFSMRDGCRPASAFRYSNPPTAK